MEHRTCRQPLRLRVLVVQHLQPLGFGYLHVAKLGLSFIDAGIADAVLAAKLCERRARLVLVKNADNLLVCETIALHALAVDLH